VRMVGLGPAKAGRQGVTLPISEGLLDQRHGYGYLFLGGGFNLRAGKRSVTVKKLVLDTNHRSLRGRIDGIDMRIAEPSPHRVRIDGFNLGLTLGSLNLTGRAAGTLNHKLGLHGVFAPRHSLAAVTAIAEFETISVRSGAISFTLDQHFQERLASIETTLVAAESAKVVGTSPTVIWTPVWEGQLAPDLSLGVLLSNGGIEFLQHGEPFDRTVYFLTTDVALDSKLVTGVANVITGPQYGPYSGPLGSFPSGSVGQANPETGEVSATSLPVALHPELASVLNQALGAPKGHPEFFTGGEIIGTLSFSIQTR
jgi:hypothetical protein